MNRIEQRGQYHDMAARLRQLSQEVILAQEKERQRVALELHDEAGQALTVLKVSLELLLADLSQGEISDLFEESVCKRLEASICLCERTMSQIRLLAHDLHPAGLEDVGLNLALEGFCIDFSDRTRLPITYQGIETLPLSDAAQVCLYRFLQESLTNVVKHAHAHQVWVELREVNRQVRLSVKDDGIGFNLQRATSPLYPPRGLGLFGLQERLDMVGGRLEISTHPGRGTCLLALIPKEAGNEPNQQDSRDPGR